MIKVSIILPVYNVEPYLDETMRSLTGQSLSEIEIIAVNDGSTDGSEEILKRYKAIDARVSYYNQPNRGQSAARNLALKHAKGQYIYFMDADDIISTDAMKACYEYAEKTRADFVFFDGDMMTEEGAQPVVMSYKRTQFFKENTAYNGEQYLQLMLDAGKYSCVVWLLFIRHDFLQRIRLSFYEGIIHEDELYTTILTLSSRNIYCLQRSLVSHRVRRASTMGKKYSARNLNCYLTVADEMLKFQDSPIVRQYLRYTLSIVFYTGHLIPFKEKPAVFWRALRSGYLKYIGLKSALAFWLKSF